MKSKTDKKQKTAEKKTAEKKTVATNYDADKMVIVLCVKAEYRGVEVPGLKSGQAWANPTREGKHRCTVCQDVTHAVLPRKKG